ncbi:putative phosphatidylethanolaminen-methyltransfer ase-lik e protein [Trypanosoma grayi]|uniref:putative phosphatidylethanolaminen-methyltransfer ase-lik e protein n=1 Tax=Trypanosoma grayi TaxID=71804 RepID=UPI0004F4AD52|nr:putative phosphatidylethanolaminen-methyltransfer ase-lik e protein [Trypanosoma grayi]KEG09063.1 putative phosphatidylethanolaminen-methyltransfer ase-lik e protein [Trypanosoma grayi]
MASAVEWRSIIIAGAAIAGLPLLWNLLARNEYRRHTMERLVGSKRRGAYLLAAWIFVFSSLRDAAFLRAVAANPPSRVLPLVPTSGKHALLLTRGLKATSTALVLFGTTLVASAFLRLGVTGTYLGDYFGTTTKGRVTVFPFSHFRNPMYLGATMNFLGAAIAQNSSVGVTLTAWMGFVYHVATAYFEKPFTSMMYANEAEQQERPV